MIVPLPSAEPVLERNCEPRLADGYLAAVQGRDGHRVVLMHGGKALVRGSRLELLPGAGLPGDLPEGTLTVYLGEVLAGRHPRLPDGTDVVLKVLPDDGAVPAWVPDGAVFAGYRAVAAELSAADAAIFIMAQAVSNWHATHPRCPRCGAPTRVEHAGWMRRCTADGSEHFPRTDPAAIVAIVGADDRILLASNFAWDANRYSTVAGFVESGESAEQAAVREIREEVGVHLHSVRYVGSQAWPFPRSLMLGFIAHTDDAVGTPDNTEVREARWFAREELQELVLRGEVVISPRLSIARALIEHWYGGTIREPGEPDSDGASGTSGTSGISDTAGTIGTGGRS